MRSRRHTFAIVASLLLCIAIVVLWARSWTEAGRRNDCIRWRSTRSYWIGSGFGSLGVESGPLRSREGMWPTATKQVSFLGFYAWRQWHGVEYVTSVAIPYWPFFLLSVVLPIRGSAVALRAYRRRVRVKSGQCATCGYDLRFSSERCPECGEPVRPTSSEKVAKRPHAIRHGNPLPI